MKWIEIAIGVSREDIDIICEIFDAIGTGGVVIEDPALIYDVIEKGSSETVAPEMPRPEPGSPPVIKGYLPADGRLEKRVAYLRTAIGNINKSYPQRISLNEMEEGDWADRWREYYHPFRVGRRLMVKPTWEPAEMEEGLLVIEMDPGMAFGCGTHETTSMCMKLLEEAVTGDELVIDVGTGSGILAITAAMLGASGVLAVDTDATAVRTAGENVARNGLEHVITVREGNLLGGIDYRADIIVANIIADVVIMLVPEALRLLKDGGKFIASGIISGRADEVAGVLAGAGLSVSKFLSEGEWVAFLAEKKAYR
ncbi:MAG: 50S ribosomal protein L11 methyltransferase [Bacillota bacterium]